METLAKDHGEVPAAYGMRSDGASLLMLFASPSGTWTAVIVLPNEMVCIVDAGTDWSGPRPPAAEPKGDPS